MALYLYGMEYAKMTATEAVLHFWKNSFKEVFAGKKRREYFRAAAIIRAAKNGWVSNVRAKWLLETYGGESYRVTTAFEVAITETKI